MKKIDGFQGTFISANGSSRDYIILEELTAAKGGRTLEAMVNEPVNFQDAINCLHIDHATLRYYVWP